MSRKLTQEEFIEKSNKVHNNKYDYSEAVYKGNKEKVIITCKTHGNFEQSAGNHFQGKGCKKCFDAKRHEQKLERINSKIKEPVDKTAEFIKKSKIKQGEKYDYSLVNYIDAKTKVEIICPEHGVFKQSPSNHLHGFGCMKCARKAQGDSKRIDLEQFIKKSQEVHNGLYSYPNTIYIQSNEKVKIECPYHGEFEQTPNAHMAGKGCEKCARIYNTFIREDYVEMAKGRETILYIIRCWNEEEEFYKIGKTFTSIKERYSGSSDMPYNHELVHTFISDALTVCNMEVSLHKKYGKYNYLPKILFGGYTECYSKNLPLENVLEL